MKQRDVPSVYTILHTNDIHNHLTQDQCSVLRIRRESLSDRGLLLDAGDAIASGNITFRPGGEPILARMTEVGYDAMTVGNREFHFSRVGFHRKLSRAGFPILCANVHCNAGSVALNETDMVLDGPSGVEKMDPPVYAWRQFVLAGNYRVAVFGVTVPMITQRMRVSRVSAYVFDDPIDTAIMLAQKLRDSIAPDLVVCLSHIGERSDRLIAQRTRNIDLIIGGHSHHTFPSGLTVDGTLIVQAGSHGRLFGSVDITRMSNGEFKLESRVEEL